MRSVIRFITKNTFSGDIESLIQSLTNDIRAGATAMILKTGEYHKMPGHQEALFELGEEINLVDTVRLTGTSPVYITEDEAIFDTSQGSDIYIGEIQWIHFEVSAQSLRGRILT